MILKVVVVGPYQENTYIIGSDETKEAALVDPGAQWQSIMKAVEDAGLKVKMILTT
ncbi:MAG: MBL fold metallo-hydrolase, partial [Chloroflexi bacterium]|nr:MBL fold metallo-hydrolase [Chloroflexota bacterium]